MPSHDSVWSLLVGFGVVVGLRLLDWVLPRGYIWRRVKEWSVRAEDEDDTDDLH